MLIGQIQAYIFTILATVYIGSAAQAENELKMKKKRKEVKIMSSVDLIAVASIFTAGLLWPLALLPCHRRRLSFGPALGAIAQQPDEANTIRTLFVGLAMVESTGIYVWLFP